MKKIKIPSPERFRDHISRYFRSLIKYKGHFAPAMNKVFGTTWPVFNAYVCPICLQNILVLTGDGNIYGSSGFDIDHFPPQCADGKNKIIVCVSCNNTAGSKFESELMYFLNAESYKLKFPKATIKTKVILNYAGQQVPGKYSAKLQMQADGQHLLDWGNTKKIPFVRAFDSYSASGATDWSMQMEIKNPDISKVTQALVKAAYLYCFSLWGYEFAFSENAEKMRAVFAGKITYPSGAAFAYFLTENLNRIPHGVAFIDSPETHKNLIVNIPLTIKEINFKCIVGVLIPKPTANGWTELADFTVPAEEIMIKNLTPYDINTQLKGYTLAWEHISNGTVQELPPKPIG